MQNDSLFNKAHDTKPMAQFIAEIVRFIEIIQERKTKIMVTIGVWTGGVEKLVYEAFNGNIKIIGIDIGNPRNDKDCHIKDIPGIKIFDNCDSRKKSTIDRLKKELSGEKIDVLFIDGAHDYKTVKSDYEMYSPLVREGGMVAFHDIKDTEEHVRNKVDVPRLWRKIKKGKKTEEICEFAPENYGGDMGGIGIIYK